MLQRCCCALRPVTAAHRYPSPLLTAVPVDIDLVAAQVPVHHWRVHGVEVLQPLQDLTGHALHSLAHGKSGKNAPAAAWQAQQQRHGRHSSTRLPTGTVVLLVAGLTFRCVLPPPAFVSSARAPACACAPPHPSCMPLVPESTRQPTTTHDRDSATSVQLQLG